MQHIIKLPQGPVRYWRAGPESSQPPVVFVHGLLSNAELWSGVAARLAADGVASYSPDWPLGSHTLGMSSDADLSPRGVARVVIAFLNALDLRDVTLVGNDCGGAICQYVLDTDHSRVGRLVLTNADAFEVFEPPPFDIVRVLRHPALLHVFMRLARWTPLRHSALGYGLLVSKTPDAQMTRRWVEYVLRDRDVRRDTISFLQSIDKSDLKDVSGRMHRFDKPALLVWGAADRFFTLDLARRLLDVFPNAQLVEVAGGRTFLPLDEPRRVSDEIVAHFYRPAARQAPPITDEAGATEVWPGQ